MRSRLSLAVVVAVFVLGALSVYWYYQEGEPSRAVQLTDEYILVLGLDEFEGQRRTDTILLVRLEEDAVKVLSIPRDLRVKYEDGSVHKLNAAYQDGGPELSRRLVSGLLGVEIPWHVVVDFQGFITLIDAIGGLPITLEEPIRYEDTKQNLVIDLPAGFQVLTGEQALLYWRYRGEESDLSRIRRQQGFLKALAQRLSELDLSPSEIKTLIKTAFRSVQTNLSLRDALRLGEHLRTLGPEALHTAVLPGYAKVIDDTSYFLMDPVEAAALVQEFFYEQEVTTNRDVRVIVLNGHPDEIKRMRLASRVSDHLEAQGFQIVAYWNADALDYPNSYLIDVSGDEEKVQRLVRSLKAPFRIVTPEEFARQTLEAFGEDRLAKIRQILADTAVPPKDRGVELTEADVVLILGGDFDPDALLAIPELP